MMEIETPKMDSRLPNYMNMSDLNKLLHFLEMSKGRFALRNHLLILLIATTGMRRQEIVDFTWQQVDLDNSTIKVLGKGKKEQLLPLHPSLYELFQEYQDSMLEYKRYPEESVFRNKDRKN